MKRVTHPFIVVALAAVFTAAACTDGDEAPAIGRDGSTIVREARESAPTDIPRAYSITFRVEDLETDGVRLTSAELIVERPFRSRLTTTGADFLSERVADFAYLGEGAAVFTPPPQPAVSDIRGDLLFASDDAVEAREVAGRTCWVHRLGGPLTGGVVTPGETTDVCIDEEGLLLEQVVREGRTITSRWVATAVDTSPDLGEDDFRVDGEPVAADAGGGSVRGVEPTSRSVGQFWELDSPPAGFSHEGRFAIVPPQAARVDDPETRVQVVAGVIDVWVSGIDVLLVDQGGTLGQVPPFGATPNSELVDLGAVARTAEVFCTPTGSEVRVLIPPGRYIRVAGSFAPDDLVAIARSLREVEGEGLVYLDEE